MPAMRLDASLLGLAAAALLGCGRPPAAIAPAPATGEPVDAGLADAPPPDAAVPDAPPPVAWVDPARCVSPCDAEPAKLVRVDRDGEPAAGGDHRVDASVVEPLRALIAAARADGHRLRINSAYRSYDDQARIFRTTKQAGRAARPGHSEHQLGTALDLDLRTRKAIDWLASHAADHGFALSYPPGKQRITGYRPEPWHVRFVGAELAAELRAGGATLEELLRASPARGAAGACGDCPSPISRADCGETTAAGTCDGTVLRWCYDGALAEVDCAASRQRCARAPGGELDCVE